MIWPKCVSRQGRWEVSTHVSNLFMLANTQCWYDPGAGVGWRYCPVTTRISLTINIQYTHPVIPAEIMYWQEFINTSSSTLSLLSPDIEDQILFSNERHENWNYVVVGTKEDREVMIASMMMETTDWRLELDMDILQQSGGHKRLPLHHPVWDPPSNPWYISQSYLLHLLQP